MLNTTKQFTVICILLLGLNGVCAPRAGKKPSPFDRMPPATRELMRKMELARPLMEDAMISFEAVKAYFPAEDGVNRNFLPIRKLQRPPNKGTLKLVPGPDLVAGFSSTTTTRKILVIDEKLRMNYVRWPGSAIIPAFTIRRDKGIFLLSCNFDVSPNAWALFQIDKAGTLRKIFDIDARELGGKDSPWQGKGLVLRWVDFFEWGSGYGLLCTFEKTLRTTMEKQRAWIVRFDSKFHRTGVVGVNGGGGYNAIPVGPGRKLAAVLQPNSITFVHEDGKCDTVPIPHAQPWADKMFAGYVSGSFSGGIVPGAKLFAMAYGDRGTLPVIDITTKPPALIHTLDIAGLSLNTVVSLVAGERVFAKMNRSSRIRAWDFSHGSNLLWTRELPGITNTYLTSFGYYKGNVIVLGKTIIYFVDENTGMVNYTFCAPSAQKRYDEFRKTGHGPVGFPPYFISYAILGRYLIASSHNFHDPLYVWEIPDKLIPRKKPIPKKSDAATGK